MEILLHYVWKHKLFPLGPLTTVDGQEVDVIDPGLHNRHQGPDFFNAKVKIGGTLWVGNVEIHDAASDWYRHHHDADEAYDNVVLHVVERSDMTVQTQQGRTLPQLVLEVPETVRQNYAELLPGVIGGCEETTTGILRLRTLDREHRLMFPMMLVNDADCKHLFDNRYGTGQSVWDGIDRTTNLIVAGKYVVVAGYGWCGKGVAMRAKGLGAKVIVTEIDPIKAMEAVMDGFEVMSMSQAAALGDIFVTVTGCDDVVRREHFLAMKDGAICCNAGHFDCEVNVAALKEMAVSSRVARTNIQEYVLESGRRIFILAEGRLVNLAAGDGHPAEIMDMSFAIQALSARYLVENRDTLSRRPGEMLHKVPASIDGEVAARKLADWGISIDVLTEEQRKYLYGE